MKRGSDHFLEETKYSNKNFKFYVKNSEEIHNKFKFEPSNKCKFCNSSITENWRYGPDGSNTLCNDCGIKWIFKVKEENKKLIIKSNPNMPEQLICKICFLVWPSSHLENLKDYEEHKINCLKGTNLIFFNF